MYYINPWIFYVISLINNIQIICVSVAVGVVNEPVDNIVELIVKMDEPYLNIIRKFKDYLDSRTLSTGKRLETLYKGYGALAFYITNEIKSGGENK